MHFKEKINSVKKEMIAYIYDKIEASDPEEMTLELDLGSQPSVSVSRGGIIVNCKLERMEAYKTNKGEKDVLAYNDEGDEVFLTELDPEELLLVLADVECQEVYNS